MCSIDPRLLIIYQFPVHATALWFTIAAGERHRMCNDNRVRASGVTGLLSFGGQSHLLAVLKLLAVWAHRSSPLFPWLDKKRICAQRSEERRVGKECRSRWRGCQ